MLSNESIKHTESELKKKKKKIQKKKKTYLLSISNLPQFNYFLCMDSTVTITYRGQSLAELVNSTSSRIICKIRRT